ncbi:MAG: PP2C family protein-serine/threonine phosphatase [Bacillota bacterium]|nr:PP2C family protein-serine/threonine phosphatase [Bacillota bacterium]
MNIRSQIRKLTLKHSFLLVLSIVILLGFVFTRNQFSQVLDNARGLGSTVVDYLDGDRMEAYAYSEKKDWEYEKTKRALQKLKGHYPDCAYMYVIVPKNENEAIYVYDIFSEEEYLNHKVDEARLGEVENYKEVTIGHDIDLFDVLSYENRLYVDLFNKYGAFASYYLPVYGSDGMVKAIVGIDYLLMDFFFLILRMLAYVVILIIFITIVLSRFENKEIDELFIKPIENMSQKANRFANSVYDGDSSKYTISAKQNSENELDILACDLNKMMKDMDSYFKNIQVITAEKERIHTELELAKKIQQSSLPKDFPVQKEFELFALMNPAKEVGGDFYDFFLIDSDHLALVIADVAGKGIGAALFMMAAKMSVKNQAMNVDSPAKILEAVNNRLCEQNEAQMFLTAWIGILELSTGKLTCANAGHEYPVLQKSEGMFSLYKDKHGFVLGGMDGVHYKDYVLQLEARDKIFVYTDGVLEATNTNNELFGTNRMLDSLNQHRNEPLEPLLNNVRKDIQSFVQTAEQFDDITMLGIQYKG